jgi:hypothetical protein
MCVRVGARVRGRLHTRARARVALLIQQATRMRHIVTSFVAPLAQSYFSALSRKEHNFRGKKFAKHKICFDSFYKQCQNNLSFKEEFSEMS